MSTPHHQRVALHVGLPHSGAPVVQSTLSGHREPLLDAGFRCPDRNDVETAWDRVCLEAREHHGTTIISNEGLAAASCRTVASALSMLRGLEVHLVVTARDLAGQVAAGWEASAVAGRHADIEDFCEQVLSRHRTHEQAREFWASQDLPAVLARWGSDLPRENVHVVCADGAEELWARFTEVVGLDPDVFPLPPQASAAPSLGSTDLELLRRVNGALADHRFEQPQHRRLATHYVTHAPRSTHPHTPPPLPAGRIPDVVAVAQRWAGQIEASGYRVYGDVENLVPALDSGAPSEPRRSELSTQVHTAVPVIAELLRDVDRLRARAESLKSDKKALKKKRKKLKLRLAEALGD